jgi:hypothetical protein
MKKYSTLILIFACSFYELHATIRYVKPSSTGTGSGNSWANASYDLQSMINASSAGDEVWVASGTYLAMYFPPDCSCGLGGPSNPNNTFLLKSGVKLYGGFVGTETSILQRNFTTNETILSGYDVCYHVVTAVNCNNTTLLDKFTIKAGKATGTSYLMISGRAVYGAWGGGMVSISSSVRIQNCSFVNNTAESGGGMLNSDGSSPTIYNSVFANNTADGGGGIYNHDYSSPTLNNCTIAYNTGTIAGGAMYNYNGSQPAINMGIIWGNIGNSYAGVANNGGALAVNQSIVQEGYFPCTSCPNTNGNTDPLFSNSADPNGADNRWGNADDGLALSICSPAIDAAGSGSYLSLDIAGQNRIFDVLFRQNVGAFGVDLGAYENQSTIPTRIYVNNSLTTGANNGTSWEDAFRSPTTALQDALNAACAGNEIWVAGGTYKPSAYPTGCTGCSSNRDFTFLLKDDVKLYGGFAGTETSLNHQNLEAYFTNLSGDIGVPDDITDNVFHVLLSLNDGAGTKLNGFKIVSGGDNTFAEPYPSITVEGHQIKNHYGGGMYNFRSKIQINDTDFILNRAHHGAGIYNNSSDDILITKCSFDSNYGSGIANLSSAAIIQRCTFFYNWGIFGGGLFNSLSSARVENCLFISNVGNNNGGAIYNYDVSSPQILNCTIISNTSLYSEYGGGIVNTWYSTPTIKNTILWNNSGFSGTGNLTTEATASATVTNCIVQGGYTSCSSCPNTNGDINPQFVNFSNLLGIDNKIKTFDDGLALKNTSPAIDEGTNSGTPTTDIVGNPRFVNADIGAYEFMPKNICIDKRYIADAPIETGTHIGTQQIVSIGTVGNGTSVVFDSPSITLLPGFQTQPNTVFRTQNTGCFDATYSR